MDLSILPDFIAETSEHLDEIESNLMLLEEDPKSMEIINDVFRSVHSIKGSAEYMGIEKTARLSHELENLLEIIRQGDLSSESDIVETLIESRDRVAELTRELEEFQEEHSEVEDLIKKIRAFSEKNEDKQETAENPEQRVKEISEEIKQDSSAKADTLSNIEDAFAGLKTILWEMNRGDITDDGKNAVIDNLDLLVGYSQSLNLEDAASHIRKMRKLADTLAYQDDAGDILADLHALGKMIQDLNLDTALGSEIVPGEVEKEQQSDELCDTMDEAVNSETAIYIDEADEELFEIFLEHMKKKLILLSKNAKSLLTANDNTAILDNSLDLVEALKSSANYMDYSELVEIYDNLAEEIIGFQQNLFPDEDSDYQKFIKSGIQTYINRVIKLFPRHLDEKAIKCEQEEEPEPVSEDIIADGSDLEADHTTSEMIDDLERRDPGICVGLSDELDTVFDLPADVLGDFEKEPEPFLGDMEKELTSSVATGRIDETSEFVAGELEDGEGELPQAKITENVSEEIGNALESLIEGDFSEGGSDEDIPQYKAADVMDEAEEHEVETIDGDTSVIEEVQQYEAAEVDKHVYSGAGEEIVERKGDESSQPGIKRFDGLGKKVVKQTMRVDSRKIDTLMNQAGELVVSRAGFAQLFSEFLDFQHYMQEQSLLAPKEMKQLKTLTVRLNESTVALGRVANELQEGVMKVRMLRISQLFNRYPRLVRDLTHGTEKQISLEVTGEETELDKMVIEEIADPLVHIIRNCVDHGIETISEREKQGKTKKGTIRLEAYHESNHVVILISDDGKGIDPEHIKEVAIKKSLLPVEEVERMTRKDLTGLIMKPGFSTADTITKTSGRGVGMDVVKKNIEQLNGTIEIESKIGKGTRIRIKIPLTLAIIKALLVKVGKEIFTIPLATVEETLLVTTGEISVIEGVEVIQLRDTVLSLVRLTNLFNVHSESDRSEKIYVVVVNTGMRQVGIVVDSLIGQEETVIKPLVDYLQENSGFSGATILGDGRISLILDIYELINLTMNKQLNRRGQAFFQDNFSALSFEDDSGETFTETFH